MQPQLQLQRRSTRSYAIPRDPTRSHAIHANPRDPTRSHAIPRDPTRSHATRARTRSAITDRCTSQDDAVLRHSDVRLHRAPQRPVRRVGLEAAAPTLRKLEQTKCVHVVRPGRTVARAVPPGGAARLRLLRRNVHPAVTPRVHVLEAGGVARFGALAERAHRACPPLAPERSEDPVVRRDGTLITNGEDPPHLVHGLEQRRALDFGWRLLHPVALVHPARSEGVGIRRGVEARSRVTYPLGGEPRRERLDHIIDRVTCNVATETELVSLRTK